MLRLDLSLPPHVPGAWLIKSRPDLCKGPGPGNKFPSRSCCRSGSQEILSLWVIYRGVQDHFLPFLFPSNLGLLTLLSAPLASASTCCVHGDWVTGEPEDPSQVHRARVLAVSFSLLLPFGPHTWQAPIYFLTSSVTQRREEPRTVLRGPECRSERANCGATGLGNG